jgi:hypothetical protein
LDASALDEVNRFRNTVPAIAATAIAFWLISDGVVPLD